MKQHENDVRFLEGRAPFNVVSFKGETFPRFLEGKATFLKGKAAFLKGKAACSKGREAFLKGDVCPPRASPFKESCSPF